MPVPQANLGITKTVTPNNPTVGSNVVFTITVNNAGPSDANLVEVTDTLPSGYTYVPSVPSQGTYDPATNIWNIGSIPNGGTVVFNMSATVNVSGEYTNCATVSGEEGDPSTTNNTACASPVPTALANLVVSKSVNISSPYVGAQVVFTINVTNVGPSDATGVEITDQLPSGYTLDSAVTATGTYLAPIWDIGSIANNGTETLLIYATVNPAGSWANTACVTAAGQTDPNTSNNCSTATTTPVPVTNFCLEKTVNDSTPNVGDTVIFTLVANNSGPNNASGVVVADALPNGYSFVSSAGGTYVASNWFIGVLNVGITETLTITAVVNPTGDYENIASISGNQVDPDPSCDSDTATTVPVQLSDLVVTKTVSPSDPDVGTDVTFTITVQNNGPNNATGVVVTDTLPSGYDYVSSTQAGYDVASSNWDPVTIPNGSTVTYSITATVLATGTYVNTANAYGDQVDLDSTDNTSSTAPTPDPVSDLAITKTINPTDPSVGDTVVFTIVASNFGPSPTALVTVYDTLPSGYTYVSSTVSNGTYDTTSSAWDISLLPNLGTDTLTITAIVGLTGNYTNIATITGYNDPNTTNNIATATPGIQNIPPTAVNDTILVIEDISTSPTQIVSTNDIDPDGTPLQIPDVSTVDLQPGISAAGGNVSVNLQGQIIYTPPLNFNGTDSIDYTVDDNSGAVSNVAWIFFNVDPVNDPPVVINETVDSPEDSLATGNILTLTGDNDPDGTTLVVDTVPVLDPTNGVITIDSLGNFIYTPDSNFFGIDTIVFEVCDQGIPGSGLCVNDTLFINVTPVNDPPVAVDDDTTTLEDTPVTIDVLANDYDIDGTLLPATTDLDTLVINGVQDSVTNIYGTWQTDGNGNLTYTPAPNFTGVATIQYTVCDTSLLVSNIATVTITVLPVNDTVSQGNEDITVLEDETLPTIVDLTDNNIDVDSTVVYIDTIVSASANGTVVILPGDTTVSYVPFPGFMVWIQ